jgi:hypothetical protein
MLSEACNCSTWKADAEELTVQGQPVLPRVTLLKKEK